MKTTEQWLAIPLDDLPVKLGEVLTPEPWKHDIGGYGRAYCHKCEMFGCTGPCSVPDSIDIKDWNTAKCWESKMIDAQPLEYRRALQSLYVIHPTMWKIILDRNPRKRLIAAAIAMDRSKE